MTSFYLSFAAKLQTLEATSSKYYQATYNPNSQATVATQIAKVDPYSGKVQYQIPLIQKPISNDLSLTLNISNTYDHRFDDSRYPITPLGRIGHIASGIKNIKRGSLTLPQFIDSTGSPHLFYLNKDGNYYSTDGWKAHLTKSGEYYSGTIYSPDGTIFTIDKGGNDFSPLTKVADITGKNYIDYTYSGGFYLKAITTSDGYNVSINYTHTTFNLGPYSGLQTIREITTTDGKKYTFSFPPLSGWKNTYDSGHLDITIPDGSKWHLITGGVFSNPGIPKFIVEGVIKEIDYPNGASQKFSYEYMDSNSKGVVTTSSTNYKLLPSGTQTYHYSFSNAKQNTTVSLGNKEISYIFENPADYPWNKGLLDAQNIIDLNSKKTIKSVINTWSSRKLSTTVGGSQPLLTKKVITQDGATYTTENKNFDNQGYPLQTVEVGNDTRVINRTYYEDLTHWIFKLKSENITNSKGVIANQKVNTYNNLGQLTSSSTNGVTTTYSYDAQGNLATEKNALGYVTTYKNYVAGHPTEVIGPTISKTAKPAFDDKYTVNLNGTIANTTDSWGNQTVYTYDAMSRIKSITKYKGLASAGVKAELPTTIQWNTPNLGDQSITQGTKSTVTTYEVNSAGNLQQTVTTTDSATKKSKTVTDIYDAIGNIIENIQPTANGAIAKINTYDVLGRLLSTYHQNINQSHYQGKMTNLYFRKANGMSGIQGLLKGDINLPKDGTVTSGTISINSGWFSCNGPQVSQPSTYDFYLNNKLIDSFTHGEGSAQCKNTLIILPINISLTGKNITTSNKSLHFYDTGYMLISPDFISYDIMLISYTDHKDVTSYTYTSNGIKIISPEGKTISYTYQNFAEPSDSNIYKVTDGLGHTTTTQRDVMGRVLSITQNALVHTYTYDAKNHFYLTAETTPELGAISYGRNLLGAMTSKTIAGKTTHYGYDEAGNLTSITYPDNTTNHDNITQTYQYGKLITSQNNNGTWSYSYNALGDMATAIYKNNTTSYPFSYGYDNYGTLSTLTYPDGHVYDYKPNALGEATQAGSQITGVTYFDDGVLSGYNTQAGNHVAVSEDDLGRLHTLTIQHDNANLYKKTYNYDLDNNLSSIVDGIHTNNESFGYDKANQLTSAKGLWGDATFTYDANGNISTLSIGSRSLSYQYNTAKNLLTSVTGTQPQTFSYDYLGNMSGVNGNTLTFNAANQLIQVKTPTKTIHYSYDANGNRIAINDGTNNTLELYISNNLMYEVTGVNKTDYVYLDGKLVNKLTNGVSEYLFSNLWGSPVAASSNASGGALLWTQEYAPYGKEINDLSTKRDKDHIGYTGKVFDNDIDLNYMNARYYDPEIGRFISYDPASINPSSPLTFNRYAYAANNPYAYIDPTGMSFLGDLWNGVVRNFENIGIGFSYGASGGIIGAGMQGQNGFDYMWYYGGMAVGTAVGVTGGATEEGMAVRGATAAYETIPKSKSLVEWDKGWPVKDGFTGGWSTTTVLEKGTILDRYGSEYGGYLAPKGTLWTNRALRDGSEEASLARKYTVYQVEKPFAVQAGTAAPAFGEKGLGIQYKLKSLSDGTEPSVISHLKNGYLSEV